ncbi:unnamed protein product [Strongylus vulgaris]|uniref:Uncharacterized protein n=1 Tax=Strongylus vulgaris TaxID=40348 RepID=A0A3P7JLW9_STRVU|nr:unnamed protein product [Strongylus vulgaris]
MLMFDLSAPEAVSINAMSQAIQGIAAAVILLPFLFLDIGKRLKQRTVNIACVLGFIAFHLITYPWDFGQSNVTAHQQDSPEGGCDAGRFDWCSTTPKVNKWVYYGSLCLVFEVTCEFRKNSIKGTMQGIFQMSGSVARMAAPILLKSVFFSRKQKHFIHTRDFSLVYSHFGPRGVWQVEIAQFAFTLALWLLFLPRLVPLEKLHRPKDIKQKDSA